MKQKKPTKFKYIVLPYLAFIIIPTLIFLGLTYVFIEFDIFVFVFIGLSSLLFFGLIGLFFVQYDIEIYEEKLQDWKYHQITIDEYLKDRK